MKHIAPKTFLICATLCATTLFAQKKETPFMTVGEKQYYPSQFYNAYFENYLNTTDPDSKDVTKFAQTYAGFCAEVAEAKAIGLDTMATFKQSVDAYTQQYTSPYYNDNQAIEKLARQVAQRSEQDVKIAHILIPVSPFAFEKDSIAAKTRIDSIYSALKGGASWDDLAKKINGSENGGLLGFIAPFQLPYQMENAAYDTPVGNISAPFRSKYGYHVVKVLEKRPARGLVEIAHIMIMRKESEDKNATALKDMREALKKIKAGEKFETVAVGYTEDASTQAGGGYLGFYGIGELRPEIEDLVYALNPGETTNIIATPEGWTIIKLLNKVSNTDYDARSTFLKQGIINDERYIPYQRAYAKNIRSKYKYEINQEQLPKTITTLSNMGFLYGDWKANMIADGSNPLFSLDTETFYADNFYSALMLSMDSYGENAELKQIIDSKLDDYSASVAVQLYVNSLPKTDPKVSAAVKDYSEKALVYALVSQACRDSLASVDIDTLHSIYDKNPNDFMWGERVTFDVATTSDKDAAVKIHSMLKDGKTLNEALFAVNKGLVSVASGQELTDTPENAFNKDFQVKKGVVDIIEENGKFFIFNIKEMLPSTRKTYDEAYQDIQKAYVNQCAKEIPNILCRKYNVQIFAKELKNLEKGVQSQKKERGIK